MSDFKYLKASDGTGEAVLAHITSNRAVAATVIEVDSVDNWPDEFIATTGTILASGMLDPTSKTQFRGHLDSGDIIIDEFCAGYTDNGNTDDEVVIIKQTTDWADLVAEAVRVMQPAGVVASYAGAAAPDGWLLCNGASLLRASYPDLFTAIGTTFGAADGTHFNVPDLRGRVPAGVGSNTFSFTFASTDVTTATDQIAVAANPELITGRIVQIANPGTLPTGLAAATDYYIIVVDSTHIKLATTLANAVAGTAIDITGQGSGTNTATHTGTARTLGEHGGEQIHAVTSTEMPAHTHQKFTHSGNASTSGGFADPQVAAKVADSTPNASNTGSTGSSGAHNNMQPYLGLNYIIKV